MWTCEQTRMRRVNLLATSLFLGLGAISHFSPEASAANIADRSDRPSSLAGGVEVNAVLNTFITDSIQVDQKFPGTVIAEDANLFKTNDPADGSLSYNVPTGGPGDFIDWDDLGGDLINHRVLDLDDPATKRDTTSFPQNNECVASSQVLSKMDLTYAAVANNTKYAYLAVQRSDNNGDAGYYWIFTRKSPQQIAGQSPCSAGQTRLLYDISGPNPATGSGGDVLIAGHFKPNGAPLLRVFRAKKDENGVTAVNAVNFNAAFWTEDTAGVAAVAVNTTNTAPGAFGAAGVKGLIGGNLAPEIFAEAAIPLSVFTGGSSCGATYFGSVITRSSGAGGTSPDLKDLIGPTTFNFGSISATAFLTPSCTLSTGFEASVTGFDGQPLETATCAWTFDDGSTSNLCKGDHNFAAGSHTGTVVVTDPASGCTDTKTTAAVSVFPPLSVTANLVGSCSSTFTYDATITGGSAGTKGISWAFSGGGTTNPSSSTSKSGSVTVGTGGVNYSGTVTVTDVRSEDLTCTASNTASTPVYAPITVALNIKQSPPACPAMTSDAVTYEAVPSGGTGNYLYFWNGAPLCSGTQCVVDPLDSTFCYTQSLSVTVSDQAGICADATSLPRTYTKTTLVNGNASPAVETSWEKLSRTLGRTRLH